MFYLKKHSFNFKTDIQHVPRDSQNRNFIGCTEDILLYYTVCTSDCLLCHKFIEGRCRVVSADCRPEQ
jgi:hypothetical protein